MVVKKTVLTIRESYYRVSCPQVARQLFVLWRQNAPVAQEVDFSNVHQIIVFWCLWSNTAQHGRQNVHIFYHIWQLRVFSAPASVALATRSLTGTTFVCDGGLSGHVDALSIIVSVHICHFVGHTDH